MEFQEGSGLLEVALLLEAALTLDIAELVQGFLELAGEPLVVQAEDGEGAVGVDDVELGAVEECGFQVRDAIEAPGGVDEFLGELGLGGGGGLVFVEELVRVALVGGGVLGGEDGGTAGGGWLLVTGSWLGIGAGIGLVIRRPPMWLWHERRAILRDRRRMLLGGRGR
jgi:hypothetical protein